MGEAEAVAASVAGERQEAAMSFPQGGPPEREAVVAEAEVAAGKEVGERLKGGEALEVAVRRRSFSTRWAGEVEGEPLLPIRSRPLGRRETCREAPARPER